MRLVAKVRKVSAQRRSCCIITKKTGKDKNGLAITVRSKPEQREERCHHANIKSGTGKFGKSKTKPWALKCVVHYGT